MTAWMRFASCVGLGVVAACASTEAQSGAGGRGDEVLFLSDRDGDHDIYLHALETGVTRRLTDTDADELGIAWSPDGERVVFARKLDGKRQLFVMTVADGKESRLTTNESDDMAPAWSPDGARIAFVSDRDNQRRELYVMDAAGTNIVRVTNNERYEETPAWSPDGMQLAFGALAKDEENEQYLQVFVLSLVDGSERQLTALPGHNSAPRWSPDGTRIAFYGNVGEGDDDPDTEDNSGFQGADIFTIAPDGSELVNLTSDAEPDWQPDWSPDGARIVFARGPSDPLDIWIMNADGTDRKPLIVAPGRDEKPYWRP